MERTNSRFMYVGQVKMSLREHDQVLVIFASLRMESDVVASDIHVECEFLDGFLRIFVTYRRS